MSAELVLVRGMPGSGKSSFGEMICRYDQFVSVISADDFFMKDGRYQFNPAKLSEAHADCLARAKQGLVHGWLMVVANTFSCRWEMQPYLDLAKEIGCALRVVDLFDAGLTDQDLFERNVHDVPYQTIVQMRKRWEHDWKNGDPRAPWLRK